MRLCIPGLAILTCISSSFFVANAQSIDVKTSDAELRATIDRIVTRKLDGREIPGGYTIAIVRDGKTDFVGAYGFSDRERRKPMRIDSMFPIASITKTMTAFLAVKMSVRGAVDLKKPIQAYLPATVAIAPDLTSRPITLEALLQHSTGLPRDASTRRNIQLAQLDGFDPKIPDPASATVDALYTALRVDTPASPPGIRSYSNMGYDLAGHILEIVSGQSFSDLLEAEIARPLGMKDTTIHRSYDQNSRVPVGFSYDGDKEKFWQTPTWVPGKMVGAAGVTSTAPDLALYLAAMMDSKKLQSLFGEKRAQEILLRPRMEYFLKDNSLFAQALGWRMNVFGPYGLIYRHTGDADSHHSFVAFSRTRRIGVVVLANNGSPLLAELGDELLLMELKRRERFVGSSPLEGWTKLQMEEVAGK